MMWAIIGGVIASFALGATIGYAMGRSDGQDEVARHYEAKRRK